MAGEQQAAFFIEFKMSDALCIYPTLREFQPDAVWAVADDFPQFEIDDDVTYESSGIEKAFIEMAGIAAVRRFQMKVDVLAGERIDRR